MSVSLNDYIKSLFGQKAKDTEDYGKEYQELLDLVKTGGIEKEKLPDVPSYERMETPKTTDDELKTRAEEELGIYKNESVNAIDAEKESSAKKLEDDKTRARETVEKSAAALDAAYEKAKESASNDALKRGLARSSIALNRQASLNEGQAKEKSELFRIANEKVESLNGEIAALDLKREKALNDFNIAYASKLTSLLNSLKSERDKTAAEALKYNNSLTETEYKQSVEKSTKESDLYSRQLSQLEKEAKLKESDKSYAALYEKMRAVLAKMSKSEARDALVKDAVFKDNLNDKYYYLLYDEFGR